MKKLFLALICLGAVSMAQAGLIEIRGGAGLTAADPDAFEERVNTVAGGGLSSDEFESFNADVFVNLPVLPIGFGLRHEWLNQDQTSSAGGTTSEWDLDIRNVSLLVDLRLIDTKLYLGPIVSLGYPWAELDFRSGGTNVSDNLDADKISYSLGVEAGVNLGRFLVGAEAGYQSLELKKSDSPALQANVDLSGFYGKVLVGLTFL